MYIHSLKRPTYTVRNHIQVTAQYSDGIFLANNVKIRSALAGLT